jgi:hypothetical protein
MKKIFLHSGIIAIVVIILCMIGFKSNAQIKREGKNFTVEFNQTKGNVTNLLFTTGDFKITERTEGGVTYSCLNFAGEVFTYKKGYAELPVIHASVQLAPDKNVTMEVENGTYTDYNLDYPLLPSRGLIKRSQDPASIPYEIDPASIVDSWYPVDNATIDDPYIMRDVRGTNVYVYPILYNAAKKILRVYKTINVKLIENNTKPINPLTSNRKKVNDEMVGLYQSVFINYNNTKTSWASEVGENGDILVICTPRDTSVINPYILWKKQMGYKVTKQVVVTGTNVATTIKTAYTSNPNILYVLLVGDWADIKCNTTPSSENTVPSAAPMDPMLGCVVGTDNYPDIIIGRFSANSATDVTTQVNKTVTYEKTPTVGGTWYKTALGIASDKGPGDDNELDYEHIRNIWKGRLSKFTYTTQDTVYDIPAGYATAAMVASPINSGVGIINFCGDGAETMWGQTGFSNSNISSLTNGEKLPFIISVSCVVGEFQYSSSPCFAETWMRKSGGGAIATLMSTVEQDWNQPMIGQDYINDLLTGGYTYLNNATNPGTGMNTDHGKTHFGSLTFNGNILMYTEDATSLMELQTWTTFGDPSLQVRTDTPKNIALSDTTVNMGSFITNVTVGGVAFKNALVSIWDGVNQPFSSLTDSLGNVTITHTLAVGASATLTVTGFNLYPFIKNIIIKSATNIVEHNDFNNSINVYPNPSPDGVLHITGDLKEDGSVSIYNSSGQVVDKMNLKKGKINVTCNQLNAGMYYLIFRNNNSSNTEKLIIIGK